MNLQEIAALVAKRPVEPRMTVTRIAPAPRVRREPTETERAYGMYFEVLADRMAEKAPVVWRARPCGGWGA